MKAYPYNGHWMVKRISPERFGWDRGAINPDLSDAEFFFEYDLALPTSLYEQYPNVDREKIEALENRVTKSFLNNPLLAGTFTGYRLPVYTAVWRDCVESTYGYVYDEFNQIVLRRINYIEEGETKPKYTEADLVPMNKLTDYQKNIILKGKKTRKLLVDQWRFCTFIPYESYVVNPQYLRKPDSSLDIILDYGVLPYQENNLYSPVNMNPPYKVGTWSYLHGEVLAPISVAINPQRMINRFLSVMESYINSSGGSGVVWDKDLFLDGSSDTEDDINIKIKRGQPIGVHGRGRGVQNAIGGYNAGIKDSTVIFANLIENFKQSIDQMTGVNSGLQGQANPDQLVGVMQLMIQRGSILQQPFYDALSTIYKGLYQSVATSGKRYYIDNEVELVDAVGEDSAYIIELSKDMKLENFRIDIIPSIDTNVERQMVDQMLNLWLQSGIIDKDNYSQLYGKASYEEALYAMRQYVKAAVEMQRKAEENQMAQIPELQAQQQAAIIGQRQEQLRQEEREDLAAEKDRALKYYLKKMQIDAKKELQK